MAITTPREITQAQIATQNAASPVGAEVFAAQTGKSGISGERVQAMPDASDVSDMSEEAGMSVSSRGKPDVDKMKLRRGSGSNFEALGRIADYYDKLPDMPRDDELRELVREMRGFQEMFGREEKGTQQPTPDDVRRLLREFDGDITHQFAALETIRDQAARAGAPAGYLALLDHVRKDMEQPEAKRQILAGFAAAGEARKMAGELGTDPAAYREAYREMTREASRLDRVNTALQQFAPNQPLGEIIESFIKTAGHDLSSMGPSSDAIHLRAVVSELSRLRGLRTVVDLCDGMAATLNRMFPPAAPRPGGEEMTPRLLAFTSAAAPSQAEAEKLLHPYEAEPPEVLVAAINLLRDLHARLPASAAPSDAARLAQSRVLMAISDRLVAREDAAYGN